MKNKGINTWRFSSNPAEKIFAVECEAINTDIHGKLSGGSTLDFILAKKVNHPMGEVTDRDREVAATVIQWQGSPVGLMFLRQVQKKIEEVII